MDKKIIIEALKKLGVQLINYVKTELWGKVVDAAKEAFKVFVDELWDSVRDEIHDKLQSAITFINYYFDTEDAKERQEMIIETLMQNIELPILLKPFRGLIKRILRSKLEKVVQEGLKKLNKLA